MDSYHGASYLLGSNLNNMVIYSKDMVKLGKVKDFEVDSEEMKITHLILELEDKAAEEILGKSPKIGRAKGRLSSQLIENFGDAVILSESSKDLKGDIESL